MTKSDMQMPQNYIIIDNKDGTFSAFVNYGIFDTKEDAEKSLELIMQMMGFELKPQVTFH
jgi:hypothetical protein